MTQGYSLHIGLNNIDSTKYKGKYPTLRNAENDTDFYYQVAKANHFNATKLIGQDATSINLINNLDDIALKMDAGDILFFSYSGHGTRIKDLDEDEEDGYDEAMVLYDRLFIDDEFKYRWTKFKNDVRIFFITDSCYNGTVSRLIAIKRNIINKIWPIRIKRGIEINESVIDSNKNLSFYKELKVKTKIAPEKANCSIIHIGACQDNQLADDGDENENNGKFTLIVRKIYDNGYFKGSYKTFFDSVKLAMPSWQTPTWDVKAGKQDEEFANMSFLKI